MEMPMPAIAVLLLVLTAAVPVSAADWGLHAIVPASTPRLLLEAVDAGTTAGTPVSINKPANARHQKWSVSERADGSFRIAPAHAPGLVLAAAAGDARNGTAIVLEPDGEDPRQSWTIVSHDDGSYGLLPRHAAALGLDHFAGRPEPGARIDLWEYRAEDRHLQWFIRPLAGSGIQSSATAPAAYEPPAIDPGDVPTGATKQLRFTASTIFPGTERDVTVFIPAQYDGSTPACVYLKTDGFNAQEKQLLETMIATREMPVTVGIFVRPGDLPAPMKDTLGRRNRCLEYDGVGDDNVRFLTDELIPFVARECGLVLSDDGNDRCIAGGSSGGIAAFTAAWHRPEAFSRVYAASGSWVAFRGGHEFPTLVRKFEPRPIRAFLTTATRDMENAAGDWFLLDQEMDKALRFSGYDHRFRIVDGPHGAGYREHWREAMAYLWRGWPERVAAGAGAPRARDILVPGAGWELVAGGFQSAQGPACNADGAVFFADPVANRIHRIDPDGRVGVFVADAGRARCVTVAADGAVYALAEDQGGLVRYDAAGVGTVVHEHLRGHSLLAVPAGGFYVSGHGTHDDLPGGVWFVKDGASTLVDSGLRAATGLACRPDRWLLSVADGGSKWVYSYQINADGRLANKERFFHLHVADWDDDAGAGSVCYSLEGRQFIATRSGIQVSADDGPTQVIIPMPDRSRVHGVCIGGRNMDTLYAFCGTAVWKRTIRHHATGAFTPWTKVVGTKL